MFALIKSSLTTAIVHPVIPRECSADPNTMLYYAILTGIKPSTELQSTTLMVEESPAKAGV